MQYILSKVEKPKIIPKIDFSEGIDEENTTIVVIPTILKTREKVKELMHKLEVFYIANKSENLYFALLGDCSESNQKEEKFDIVNFRFNYPDIFWSLIWYFDINNIKTKYYNKSKELIKYYINYTNTQKHITKFKER